MSIKSLIPGTRKWKLVLQEIVEKIPRPRPRFGSVYRLRCICDCGNTTVISHVYFGITKSCGCARSDAGVKIRTHGMALTAEYRIYRGIKNRCYLPTEPAFHRYGGRGIVMSDSWLESFENFFADMGYRPSKNHSVDRINNDGPYSKENCQWRTRVQQQRNTRVNRNLTHDGQTMCVTAWAERIGIAPKVIYDRLNYGWSDERTLATPVRIYTQ